MRVFISWSGERSGALATALKEWFPLVLNDLHLWVSKADIQAGDRWSLEIAKELEASNFGILCITRENLAAPWILFEAGALAKSMQDGRVIPLLLDVDFKEVTGPLAQFQSKKFDAVGLREIVLTLNMASENPAPDNTVGRRFDALWPDVEKQIASMPKQQPQSKQSRPQGEILEELVAGIRHLDVRLRDLSDDQGASKRRRKTRVYPKMVTELSQKIGRFSGDGVKLLILTSMVRDEIPWLYELAAEVYRASRYGSEVQANRARQQFAHALEMIDRGPFLSEFEIDPYIMHRIRSELSYVARRIRPQKTGKDLQKNGTTESADNTSSDQAALMSSDDAEDFSSN